MIESSDSTMVASVDVSKAGISKTFTTSNRLADGAEILMELVDGPFKKLQGGWYFTPLDEQACKVELKLEFEFSSRMIEMAFGKIFNELTSNMVSAFTQRAKQVY
ncbi:coenzyme Q-binding protein COQ10 [Vibrio crassostreae]|nr:coenzyme Q-binding protein COQ10 [Vibrio crassostreae]CAK3896889.1 coenzyme Q-binding protein COQ10 [Vibrio crassostreae]